MKIGSRLVALVVSFVIAAGLLGSGAQAAPALQLPWPSGQIQKIDGGNTYGCDTHVGVDQWAVD